MKLDILTLSLIEKKEDYRISVEGDSLTMVVVLVVNGKHKMMKWSLNLKTHKDLIDQWFGVDTIDTVKENVRTMEQILGPSPVVF